MELLFKTLKIVAIGYALLCIILYLFQEKLIFFPEKLSKDYKFSFDRDFEEIAVETTDKKLLNGVLFKANNSKGLIFYLHGNAGAINSWGEAAKAYTDLNYDVFMLDYRGYGKSEGSIVSQQQIFDDVQAAYNELKKKYPENKIIILGYSIGTGPASQLASGRNAKLLILQAPYYSLVGMMRHSYPFIPTVILKYRFETNEYIKKCKMPVVVFHGNSDEVIPYKSSLRLKKLFKPADTLITLGGQGHNGITDNEEYLAQIKQLLN